MVKKNLFSYIFFVFIAASDDEDAALRVVLFHCSAVGGVEWFLTVDKPLSLHVGVWTVDC